jgi:hypothetical protein
MEDIMEYGAQHSMVRDLPRLLVQAVDGTPELENKIEGFVDREVSAQIAGGEGTAIGIVEVMMEAWPELTRWTETGDPETLCMIRNYVDEIRRY